MAIDKNAFTPHNVSICLSIIARAERIVVLKGPARRLSFRNAPLNIAPHRRTYYRDWVVSRARTLHPSVRLFFYTSHSTCVTQVQCENSRFHTLTAAQLSAVGGEHVPEPGAVGVACHGDEDGDSRRGVFSK